MTATKAGFLDKIEKFISLNPVLIRGVLVALATLLAQILGRTVIESETIDAVIDLFTALAALITALWARGMVIAENKVIAWKLDPAEMDSIVAGPATVITEDQLRDVYDAALVSKRQGEARADDAADRAA